MLFDPKRKVNYVWPTKYDAALHCDPFWLSLDCATSTTQFFPFFYTQLYFSLALSIYLVCNSFSFIFHLIKKHVININQKLECSKIKIKNTCWFLLPHQSQTFT